MQLWFAHLSGGSSDASFVFFHHASTIPRYVCITGTFLSTVGSRRQRFRGGEALCGRAGDCVDRSHPLGVRGVCRHPWVTLCKTRIGEYLASAVVTTGAISFPNSCVSLPGRKTDPAMCITRHFRRSRHFARRHSDKSGKLEF